MTDAPDADLLEQFVRDHSEAAFADLVERHIGLVHSVALRTTANSQHAQDITQVVFIILARKATALSRKTILAGWLYHTARLVAANYQRAEIRRNRRDQEVFMQSTLQESTPDSLWPEMSPLLDEAMSRLRASDRDALVLRYFQNKSLAEVGAAMGLAERTAQKRILRAIEKLRAYFAKRGVTNTADEIAKSISANSVQAVSPALVKAVATTAFAKGATASASILTLTKGALKIMAWTKVKITVVATTVVLLGTTASFAPYVWQYHLSPDAWRHRFEAVYRLTDGENIRYIKPPFIPERLTYYRTENPSQAKAVPRGPDLLVIQQDGDELGRPSMGFGFKPNPLQRILDNPLGFWHYEFEAPASLFNIDLAGDWTIRKDTPREELLKALEPIILKATGRKIHFEKQSVERDVIVAHGTMKGSLYGDNGIQIYAEKKDLYGGRSHGGLTGFLGTAGERLNAYVVNEARADNEASFGWVDSKDADASKMGDRREELTNMVLKNITDQTGLTFTHEKRFVDVWFITEEK
jgi:RNA polymerase sigma factor (sigma-70 family)